MIATKEKPAEGCETEQRAIFVIRRTSLLLSGDYL